MPLAGSKSSSLEAKTKFPSAIGSERGAGGTTTSSHNPSPELGKQQSAPQPHRLHSNPSPSIIGSLWQPTRQEKEAEKNKMLSSIFATDWSVPSEKESTKASEKKEVAFTLTNDVQDFFNLKGTSDTVFESIEPEKTESAGVAIAESEQTATKARSNTLPTLGHSPGASGLWDNGASLWDNNSTNAYSAFKNDLES